MMTEGCPRQSRQRLLIFFQNFHSESLQIVPMTAVMILFLVVVVTVAPAVMILFLVVVGTVAPRVRAVNLISFSSLAIKGGITTPCSKLGDSVCVCV